MRDLLLYSHVILGFLLVILPVLLLVYWKKPTAFSRLIAVITAVISWAVLIPAGSLYLMFYPATKTLILSGAWPWAHSVFMETKEHWGIMLPLATTVAAWLYIKGDPKASKKWWVLVIVLAILVAVFGRTVKLGAGTI
ncbi:MAG TPA: hypothetical protein VI968_00950 [archaeon]|nr:hypothetical protein [archaeon]